MGITPFEFQQMQKAGKPKSGNLLDMARPHEVRGREQRQIQQETAEFARNHITHEDAIGVVARENAQANWEVEDSEDGFRQFQTALHAQDARPTVLTAEEELNGLSQEEMAAKIAEVQYRADQQEQADRKAWEAFKARPTSQFLRQHPEVSESDITQIDLQLTEWRISSLKASLAQLNQAYEAVKAHGLSRPTTVRKSAESSFDPETAPMSELLQRAGGLEVNGRIVESDSYVPDPNIRYEVGGVGSKF